MNKVAQGLFAIAAAALLIVTLGAGRNSDDNSPAENVAAEKAVRTAGVDVAIGSYTCRGQSSNGEVTAGIQWKGTSSVVASSGGLGISITTVVAPASGGPAACAAVTDGLVTLAQSLSCTVSQTRLVGVTQDAVIVCSGITDDTNDAVAQLMRFIAANVRVS